MGSYPNHFSGIFLSQPLIPKIIFSPDKRRISCFGNKDGISEHHFIRDHFPCAATQFWTGQNFRWNFSGMEIPFPAGRWAQCKLSTCPVQCSKIEYSDLILLLDSLSCIQYFLPVPQRNPWIPSPSPKVPTDKQMYCKRDTAAKTLLFYFELSLVELSSY